MASAAAAPESQQPADPPRHHHHQPPDYSLAAFAHAVEATIDGVAGAIGSVSADLPTAMELEGNGSGASGAAAGGSSEEEGDVCQQAAGQQDGVYSQPGGAAPAGAHEDEFDWEQVRAVLAARHWSGRVKTATHGHQQGRIVPDRLAPNKPLHLNTQPLPSLTSVHYATLFCYPPPPRPSLHAHHPQLDIGHLDVVPISRQQLAAVRQRVVSGLTDPRRVLVRDKLSFLIGCCQVW